MSNDKIEVRPHFVYVFTLLYPYLSLLIIPVIRGIYRYLSGKENTLSTFFTAEVIMLGVAFFAAVLKLKCTSLELNGDIKVKKGLVLKRRYTIPQNIPKVIMLESDPFSRLFGIYRLKIYTEAGTRRRPDESIPIRKSTAVLILGQQRVEGQTVKSNTVGNVVMSAALSSSMTGILLAAPIVKAVAGLLGEGMATLLPKLRSDGIQPESLMELSRLLPLMLFIGYAISFAVILLRNSGFSSVHDNGRIMLDSGRLPHRTAFFNASSVNAVKTITAPLMRLAGKCAVKFSACGFGRAKGEIGLLVPCVKPELAEGLVGWLLPQFKTLKIGISPNRKSIVRCCFLPSAVFVASVVCAVIVERYFAQLSSVIWTAAMLIMVVTVLWLIARVLVLVKGGVSIDRDLCQIVGSYGFGTVELKCKLSSIEYFVIQTTPFDRLHGQCTVKVRTSFKNHDAVKVRYIESSEIKQVFSLLGVG